MTDTTLTERTLPIRRKAVNREAWADVAKGACIVLVVFWHVVTKHYLLVDWQITVPLTGLWGTLGELFLPLRMPLFFAISGVFAAAAAARPWRSTAATRVWGPYRVYLFWFVIHTAVFTLTPDFPSLHASTPAEFAAQATVIPTNLWYLWALAVYFVIGKLTRPLPAAVVLAVAFALSTAASAEWLDSPGDRVQILQNLAFYLAGLRLAGPVRRLAAHRGRYLTLGAVTLFAVSALAVSRLDASAVPGVTPLVSILGVVAGITGCAALATLASVRRSLGSLGRRTLPIYVLHLPLVALLDLALGDLFASAGTTAGLVLAATVPAVLTALVVALCLALHHLLVAAHLGVIFSTSPLLRPERRSREQAERVVDDERTEPIPRL